MPHKLWIPELCVRVSRRRTVTCHRGLTKTITRKSTKSE